jgi:ADP-ribosylglycohydrolase
MSVRGFDLLRETGITQDKCRGVILGLAIGDALGWPTEFLALSRIKAQYGPAGITDLPASEAEFTDDTQMSLAIAEALIDAGQYDLETLMRQVSLRFIEWLDSPENNKAPGNACLEGARRLKQGIPWRASGSIHSKGCGPAMRSAPIGLYYHDDPARLREVAIAAGTATHNHPTANAGSVATAYLVKLALDRDIPAERLTSDMIEKLLSFCGDLSQEFNAAILKVATVMHLEPESALDKLGQGWIAEEAVALALYCFLRTPDDYRATVTRAANSNGDSDSIACIAGAISGAWNGIQGVPPDWVQRIEKREYLFRTADRLWAASEGK